MVELAPSHFAKIRILLYAHAGGYGVRKNEQTISFKNPGKEDTPQSSRSRYLVVINIRIWMFQVQHRKGYNSIYKMCWVVNDQKNKMYENNHGLEFPYTADTFYLILTLPTIDVINKRP